MKKLIALIVSALIVGLMLATSATAIPWYSTRCSGCESTVYTHTPYTQYYYGSYTYGYSGWDNNKVHYNYRYPNYKHYYPYQWHYPYAYNYYPSPMYNTGGHSSYGGYGSYGPGIIW